MKNYLTIAFMGVCLSGCDGAPPIDVELGRNSAWGTPQLQITAKNDSVTINAVKVNRGNCTATPHEALPHKVTFGGVLKIEVSNCQKLIEVSASTSDGDYNFTFDD
ncbi:hypothetical protein [Pseudomonas aeruginosa]|uniref:hypothetical protein n=1 Tax=Pseudomonas aeruginosa TaxID=287 RepID=UPI000E320CD8|nr:hypothetical protein [Pseudomonas aeruginosa]MDE8656691.1 hypothetical protein [Pseudomonas aeruginosa]MDE8664382.1 hypothetical protein [Pseudomonas aeruginosa]MDN3859975.1 hypothetical protein [Pseudomonas aeruginosa]NQA60805.1 hypothetical protein [Pseudomonas aeruginosa]RPU02531.1 hypothetical protein IPC927_12370 [Pseudomonas aeruginosa]